MDKPEFNSFAVINASGPFRVVLCEVGIGLASEKGRKI